MQNCCKKFGQVICCESEAKYPRPYQFNFSGRDKTPVN